jgi:hypothetical protein
MDMVNVVVSKVHVISIFRIIKEAVTSDRTVIFKVQEHTVLSNTLCHTATEWCCFRERERGGGGPQRVKCTCIVPVPIVGLPVLVLTRYTAWDSERGIVWVRVRSLALGPDTRATLNNIPCPLFRVVPISFLLRGFLTRREMCVTPY